MNATDYAGLCQRLRQPRLRVLDDSAMREMRLPHRPPDDFQWPAPRTEEAVEVLLGRVSPRMQLACGLIAGDLALPIWESAVFEVRGFKFGHVHRATLATLWQWFAGTANLSQVQVYLEAVYEAEVNLDAQWLEPGAMMYAHRSIVSAVQAATVPNDPMRSRRVPTVEQGAVNFAVDAVALMALAQGPSEAFEAALARWWRVCRCRLAFADATTADFL